MITKKKLRCSEILKNRTVVVPRIYRVRSDCMEFMDVNVFDDCVKDSYRKKIEASIIFVCSRRLFKKLFFFLFRANVSKVT